MTPRDARRRFVVSAIGMALLCSSAQASSRRTDPCGGAACPTVRPGDFVELPYTQVSAVLKAPHADGVGCSAGFAFTDESRRRYVSTAGHCAADVRLGTEALDRERRPLGKLVFAEVDDSAGVDFALVELYPTTGLDPSIDGLGTPTTIDESQQRGVRTCFLRGQGVGASAMGVRTGYTTTTESPSFVRVVGVGSPQDSGAPVVTASTQALAIFIGWISGPNAAGSQGMSPDVGTFFAYRLAPQIRRANTTLRRNLALAH